MAVVSSQISIIGFIDVLSRRRSLCRQAKSDE
jgi:hypothetical protein